MSLAAVAGFVVTGVTAAANSGSFLDAVGDTAAAPDVGAVTYSSDDAGTVTVRIAIGNRAGGLAADDEVLLGIDADQVPDTGSVFYGAEAGIAFHGDALVFLRAAPSGYLAGAEKPPSVQGDFSGGVATFSFSAADVGIAAGSGFNLFVRAFGSGSADAAPDVRTVNYQLVAGTPAVVPPPDRRAPVDIAVKSRGRRGRVVHLVYAALDGRGQTADTIRVRRGRKLLKTIRVRLGDASPFTQYYAPWRVPRRIRGRLRFCVSSVDAAGNRSNVSCAPIVLG